MFDKNNVRNSKKNAITVRFNKLLGKICKYFHANEMNKNLMSENQE